MHHGCQGEVRKGIPAAPHSIQAARLCASLQEVNLAAQAPEAEGEGLKSELFVRTFVPFTAR